MMKYFKTKIGIIAVDPYKKVYQNGQLAAQLVCGRGPTPGSDWYISDQVFKVSDLGKEVYPGKRKKKQLEAFTDVPNDYAARWLARVLVYASIGGIIWLLIHLI
jgi:hypothetical protein